MLELLRIRDLALIEDLEMEFAPGMNVITGETGAGKSFILKALEFLTGEKAGPDLVRPGKEKAVVEALFERGGGEVILRRELLAESGRSRLYLNDTLSSLESIQELRAELLLHTAQHAGRKLCRPAYQLEVLDVFMRRPELPREKDRLVRLLSDCAERRRSLDDKVRALEERREVLEYQQAEIKAVDPKPGEEEALEQVREAFRNRAGISEGVESALQALAGDDESPGLWDAFSALEKTVPALARLDEEFAADAEALADVRDLLSDLEKRLRRAAARADEETDIDSVEERLFVLAQLKRKLKRSLKEILDLQTEINENLGFLDACGLDRKHLAAEEEELAKDLRLHLEGLNAVRRAAAETLAGALGNELRGLGFSPEATVLFEFSPHALVSGRDDCLEYRPRMLWRPNPGQPAQPLDRIASGGELSRFLLALAGLLGRSAEAEPTLIFDEVDAGVGGLTLNRVAERLEALAKDRQMILITHWPQLAAKASRHFLVDKRVENGNTYTRCSRLPASAVAEELARMAGGGRQGEALARELVQE